MCGQSKWDVIVARASCPRGFPSVESNHGQDARAMGRPAPMDYSGGLKCVLGGRLAVHEVVEASADDDEEEEDEGGDHGVELALVGLLSFLFDEGFDGVFFGFGGTFLEAGRADLCAVVGGEEFVEGAHSAAVGAAAFGDGVAGPVEAVAVFAPVANGVFEAAMAAQVFTALAADFAVAFFFGVDLWEVDGVVGMTGGFHCFRSIGVGGGRGQWREVRRQ